VQVIVQQNIAEAITNTASSLFKNRKQRTYMHTHTLLIVKNGWLWETKLGQLRALTSDPKVDSSH